MPPKLEKMLINKGRNAVSKTACRGFKSFCPCQSKKTLSGVFFVLFGLNCMKPRRAERAGENRCAAVCGGGRRGGEVKKQGAVRSAPSEQCDYVSEGQLKSFCPCQSKALKSLVYNGFRALILFFAMTLFFRIVIITVDYRQL